jgi:hypothetical protein
MAGRDVVVAASVDPGGWTAAAARRVPPGYVRLTSDDPPLDIYALMSAEAPRLGGALGWEITARPRQVGMTVWTGSEPMSLELGLLLDGFASGLSVEPDLRALLAVARGDDESPPGVLRVGGLPLGPDRWVIESLELGDAILRPSDASRVRVELTLTLREYVPPHYVQLRRGALQGRKGKSKVIAVRQGETPALARRYRCSWTEIRDRNPGVVTKANQALRPGTHVRVPVAVTRERKAKGSPRSTKTASSRRSS